VTDVTPAGDPRDALIREQVEQIAVLQALVDDLREKLEAALRAGSRNSGNSSIPPSMDDQPGRKPPRRERRAGAFTELHSAFSRDFPSSPQRRSRGLSTSSATLSSPAWPATPRVPGAKTTVKQKPGRELLEFCRDRRADVLRFITDTRIWPTNNLSERGVRPLRTQQKISGRLASDDVTQGPPRHQKLHRHRSQTRPQRYGRPAPAHARHALAAAAPAFSP
jgi:hypothetical protein